MNDIESYIQNNLSLEEFSFQRKKNFQDKIGRAHVRTPVTA